MPELHDIDPRESAIEDIANDIKKISEYEKCDIDGDGRYPEGIFGSKTEQFSEKKYHHRVERVEQRELGDPSNPNGFFAKAFKSEFGDRHISEKQKERPRGGSPGHEDQRKDRDHGIHADRPSEPHFQKAEKDDQGREQRRGHIENVQQSAEGNKDRTERGTE